MGVGKELPVMLDREWEKIRHFKPTEAWGDTKIIDFHLVRLLDEFRDFVDQPMIVAYGTQGKHVAKWHSLGVAVDIVIEAAYKGQLNLVLDALRYPFSGIGVYPFARYAKFEHPVGFHFDVRPLLGWASARWIGIPKGNTIEQFQLDELTLRRFNIIAAS